MSGRAGRQNLLLAGLPPIDLARLAPYLREVVLNRGDMLHEVGDTVSHAYFPLSGAVSLLAVMENGTSVETALIGREGGVGVMCGLGPRHASSRAVVQIQGHARRIDAGRLRDIATMHEAPRQMIVRYNEMLMAAIQQTAGCNALHLLEGRFCRWLLQMRDRADDDRLALTQEFLSELLGVRRPTVTLLARSLQSDGLINYRRGLVEIVDRDGIEARACECYHVIQQRMKAVYRPIN